MTGELREVWVCGDGCGLRSRQADNQPIPEPKNWEAGRCPQCRIDRERQENGPRAAEDLQHKLFRGHRRRSGPFGHADPDFEKPKEPTKRKPRRQEATREQRDEIDHALHNAFDTDKNIAVAVGVPTRVVAERRNFLGLPNGPERRTNARLATLEKFLMEDPARLRWSNEKIAEAVGSEPGKVRTDRIHLGLNPRRVKKGIR